MAYLRKAQDKEEDRHNCEKRKKYEKIPRMKQLFIAIYCILCFGTALAVGLSLFGEGGSAAIFAGFAGGTIFFWGLTYFK